MNLEIERKFLVRDDGWRLQARESTRLRQGYLANTARASVRVRIAGECAWLSVKAMQPGPARAEFEYEIPVADAALLLAEFVPALVEKCRHLVPVGRHHFELDEFEGSNRGLVLAEIELDSATEDFLRPDWLGDEVTDDLRFHNFRLAEQPFSGWPAALRARIAAGRLGGEGA